jgi:chromosome segregation ATPase
MSDSEWKIVTRFDMSKATSQIATLENRILKTADKIKTLQSEISSIKAPETSEYKNLKRELAEASKEMDKMTAQSGKIDSLNEKIAKLSQTSSELAGKMNSVEFAKNIDPQYEALSTSIEKDKFRLDALMERRNTLIKGGQEGGAEYQSISVEIVKLYEEIEKAEQKMKQLVETGKAFTIDTENSGYKDLSAKYEETNRQLEKAKTEQEGLIERQATSVEKVEELNARIQELIESGKAFGDVTQTDEYAKLARQLEYAQNDMEALVQRHDELSARQQDNASGYDRMKASAARAFKSTGNIIKSTVSRINGFTKKLKEIVQRLLPSINKSSKKTNSLISTSFKNILKYGLGIRSLYALVNKLRAAAKEGFTNLYNGSKEFKAEIDSLKASTLTLENTLAAAFSPIAEIAIPYIQKLIDYLTSLIDLVGQFIAAITGQKTYTRAVKQTTAALEDANAATNKQLSSLDNLNNMTSSSSGSSTDTSDMFEEVPISEKATELAESVKDTASQLFNPIKTAWDDVGQYVMDSWKYALQEISDLAKAIGKDFLTVWNEPETLEMLETILHIVGDIGQIVGNLAHNFRLAWEENETGLHILENVRDIIKAVVDNIHSAAEATVEWSKELDFGPLLESIEKWTKSLIQVFDFLSGVLEDIWEEIILPLTKWAVEKGLPELIQAFTDFNNKVHWEEIRNNLKTLWEHIEPFMETIGEGLIKFIKDVGAALAKFLNSQAFKDFLEAVEKFVDSVDSEDVANGLKLLCEAIVGYKVIKTAVTGLTAAKSFINIWTAGKGATVASEMTTAAGGVGILSTALEGLIAVIGGVALGEGMGTLIFGEDIMTQTNESFLNGTWIDSIKSIPENIATLWNHYWKEIETTSGSYGKAMDELIQKIDDGIIYTQEDLEKFAETYSLSAEDIEDLNTEMLANHTELMQFALEFPQYADLSVADLKKVYDQWQSIQSCTEQTISNSNDAINSSYDNLVSRVNNAETDITTDTKNIATAIDENGNKIQLDLTDKTNKIDMQIDETTGKVTTNIEDANKDILTDTTKTSGNTFTTIDKNGKKITVSLDNNTKQWKTDFDTFDTTASTDVSDVATQTSTGMKSVNNSLKTTDSQLGTSKGSFSNWASSCLSSVKSFVSSALGWIGSLIDKIGDLLSSIGSASSSASGLSTTYSNATGSSNVSRARSIASTVESPDIPALAKGTVVPPNKEFMAILGDNKTEPEVVSPLSTMEQAVENVLSRMGSGGQQEITLNIPLELDGKVIFNLMRKYDREYFKSHGSPAFE